MPLDSTPLLATDGPPSLSAGQMTLDDDHESPLAQLMRKKEPQESLIDDERYASELAAGNQHSNRHRLLSEPLLPLPHRAPRVATMRQTIRLNPPPVSYATLIGGTLVLLECSLFWGSYLSKSWSELHLVVSFDWQKRFLPGLDGTTDALLQSLSLTELIQLVNSLESKMMLVFLGVTSLIIPCGAMILHPLAITEAHQVFLGNIPFIAYGRWSDLLLRGGFFVVYLLLILDLTTTAIQLHLTETTVHLYNQIQLGFLSYVLGLLMATGVAVVLRWREPFRDNDTRTATTSENASTGGSRSWLRQIFVFESALVGVILLIVTFMMPLFRIDYHGIGVEFMEDREMIVHLKDLTQLLYTEESPSCMRILCGIVLVLQVLILPILLWICTLAYCCGFQSIKPIVRVLHPTVNPLTFAITMLVVMPQLEDLIAVLLDEQTSGFCSKFSDLLGEDCLIVTGKALWGAWALLGHAISLEVFVLLSIFW
jgi:hypothetical protein